MDIQDWQRRLRDFAAARDWQPYHAPKNLAMALMVEAAELLELFQWQTLTESRGFTREAHNKERVGEEMADVLLYLLQLADHTGVDLAQAAERKFAKNAEKHPAKKVQSSPQANPQAVSEPQPPAKVHLLVDWENVQPTGTALQALVPDGTDAWLFHGPQQRLDASSHQAAYGTGGVTLVPRSGAGRNALDFQLSYYVGYISARQPRAAFVVVSNDQGYDPMLEHARELGFDARRVEYRKPAVVAVPVKPKREPEPALAPTKSSLPTIAQITEGAWSNLRTMPIDRRPRQLPGVLDYIGLFIGAAVPGRDELVRQAWQLLLQRGDLLPPLAPEAVAPPPAAVPMAAPAFAKGSVTASANTPSVKATRQEVQMLARLLADMPAAQRPTHKGALLDMLQNHLGEAGRVSPRVEQALSQLRAQKRVTLKGDGVSYPAPVAPAQPRPAVPSAASKKPAVAVGKPQPKAVTKVSAAAADSEKPAPPTAAQLLQRVLASLKKMPENKPTRRAGMLKHIAAQAVGAAEPQALALLVLDLLVQKKHVALSANGLRLSYPARGGQTTQVLREK